MGWILQEEYQRIISMECVLNDQHYGMNNMGLVFGRLLWDEYYMISIMGLILQDEYKRVNIRGCVLKDQYQIINITGGVSWDKYQGIDLTILVLED